MTISKLLSVLFLVFLIGCSNTTQPTPTETPAAPATPPPAAKPDIGPLGEMAIPPENPQTPEKIALGKQLFFDKRLSKSGKMSCESCHLPEMGWTDGKALSTKDDGTVNTRHTPTLLNAGFYRQWYWDGRAATLEGQILAAWRGQMGADPDQIVMKLNGIEGYKTAFEKATGGPATPERVTQALANFVRTITSENAPWDKYEAGDKSAVSTEAIDGFDVFTSTRRANCTLCHLPPQYTDTLFHNVGVGFDKPMPDMGRGKILADQAKAKNTTDPEADKMMGAFKTPTLRSITETAPYFHNGSVKTLEEAVDYMLSGGNRNEHIDEKLTKRNASPQDRTKLIAFLKSLTPETQPFERPQLP
jgi:cytochrome c peroxidase